jgi:hypothetical protein
MSRFLFDGLYEKLIVQIGGGWIGFSLPRPPALETIFLEDLAGSAKGQGFVTGAVGVFGNPNVSVRSDSPVEDALRIIGLYELEVSRVKFSVHCYAEQKEGYWQILKNAGVSESLVRFEVV